jgi:hypothetical protein
VGGVAAEGVGSDAEETEKFLTFEIVGGVHADAEVDGDVLFTEAYVLEVSEISLSEKKWRSGLSEAIDDLEAAIASGDFAVFLFFLRRLVARRIRLKVVDDVLIVEIVSGRNLRRCRGDGMWRSGVDGGGGEVHGGGVVEEMAGGLGYVWNVVQTGGRRRWRGIVAKGSDGRTLRVEVMKGLLGNVGDVVEHYIYIFFFFFF